jgi:hypothetical protein
VTLVSSNRISDDYMRDMIRKAKPYTMVILHKTGKSQGPWRDQIVWEHGRRNLELRREALWVVCPVRDESDIGGVAIFFTDTEKTREIMDADLAVKVGNFTYETHDTRSFPGDALAK